jgi:hypothetical protein
MNSLLKWVKDQILVGDASGQKLAKQLSASQALHLYSGIGDKNPGLIAADFICSYIRQGTALPKKPLIIHSDETIKPDYSTFYLKELESLVKLGQYSTAIEFSRVSFPALQEDERYGFARIFSSVKKETDEDLITRELESMILNCRYLISRRISEKSALESAIEILVEITQIARNKIITVSDIKLKRVWIDILIDSLVELLSSYNHRGEAGPQKHIEEEIDKILSTYSSLISKTYHQKNELLLEVKVRNLNILFNDYRFLNMIEDDNIIMKDIGIRENNLPKEVTDELLGKMYGSVGQACAFLSKTDTTWAESARLYFEKSILNFIPGTLYHSMSVNYFAALACQESNYTLACQEMNRHPEYMKISTPTDIIDKFEQYILQDKVNIFDITNYFRITSLLVETGKVIEMKAIDSVRSHCLKKLSDEHPSEQVCKWLGYIYYLHGDNARSIELYEQGKAICLKSGFTMKTIGMSVSGLKCISLRKSGDIAGYSNELNAFKSILSSLTNESINFNKYIESVGGMDSIINIIKDSGTNSVSIISRLLPFSYS